MKQKYIKNYKLKIFLFLLFCFYLIIYNHKTYFNNIMKNIYTRTKFYNVKYKKQLFGVISKSLGQNITSVKSIFLSQNMFFGNQIQTLNNIIFVCEILRCRKIILNKKLFWYIKNRIIDRKFRRIIDIGDLNDYINTSTIIDKTNSFFNKFCENRMNILRKEILANLPKIITNSLDLYIYIRSGYFGSIYNHDYFQPPLCYYKTILNNFKFKKIFLIAKDKTNKIIDILINNYKFIIFKQNSLQVDIAYLINAYNIVGLSSSFLYSILKMNYNLKIYWHYGNHGFNFKPNVETTIFKMEPSKEYSKQIHFWKYNSSQLKLLVQDNCSNKFEIEN